MPAAQEKKLEKKRRILESAYQLFQKNNVYNTAVDDIVNALELIWADMEVWIAMNPPHAAKKRAAKKRNVKK